VGKNYILESEGRISVLAGQKKLEEMLIFLAYRKLKRALAGFSSPRINTLDVPAQILGECEREREV